MVSNVVQVTTRIAKGTVETETVLYCVSFKLVRVQYCCSTFSAYVLCSTNCTAFFLKYLNSKKGQFHYLWLSVTLKWRTVLSTVLHAIVQYSTGLYCIVLHMPHASSLQTAVQTQYSAVPSTFGAVWPKLKLVIVKL